MAFKSVRKNRKPSRSSTASGSSTDMQPSPSGKKPPRVKKTMRGYNRKAVDKLFRQKENELAEVHGQLRRNKVLLDQAQSERAAFLRSLDVAARSADELLEEAAERATQIRLAAEAEAEGLRRTATDEATEIVAATKADRAHSEAQAEEIMAMVEADKDALSNYQNELSAYLYQLGQYLMQTSTDPTIALPIEQQPAITGAPSAEETIVLAEIEAGEDHDFAEFFSDDIEQDKSRDWILKD